MNFDQVGRAVLTLEHPEVQPGVPPVCRFQIDKDNRKFEVKELLLRAGAALQGDDQVLHEGRTRIRARAPEPEGPAFLRRRPVLGDEDRPAAHARRLRAPDRHDLRRPRLRGRRGTAIARRSSIALSKDKRFIDWSFPVIDERAGQDHLPAITTFKDGTSPTAARSRLTGRRCFSARTPRRSR